MARMPSSYIPPSVSGNNFIGVQAAPAFQHSNVNPPSINFQQPNNANFVPNFASNHSPMPQQSGNRFPASSCFTMPPYIQHPGWPPVFNRPPPPFYSPLERLGYSLQEDQPPGCVSHLNVGFPQPSQAFIGQQWTRIEDVGSDEVKGHASAEEEASDASWLQSWLRCRSQEYPKSSAVTRGKNLKVFEVKQLLQGEWMILNELEVMEKALTCNSKDLSEIDWTTELKNIELKKGLFEKNFRMIEETDLKEIGRILVKRNKKRSRGRRSRHLEKEMSSKKSEDRKKLHLKIDIWLEKHKADVEILKQEVSMKQEADAVLWGVRRKQAEGRKILSLLSALVKLHHVRSKKKQPSSLPAEDEEQFSKIIEKLVQLWESQMKDYEVEEKTLRVMLQENPEEEKKKDDLKLSMSRTERSSREWEAALFGAPLSLMDALQSFFLQPSQDMSALIQTRSHWDQYISFSPRSSSIPIGWVIPHEASSEEWRMCRRE